MFIIQRGEGTGHSLHLSHPNFFCLFVLHENMLTELSEVSALQTRRGCCWGGRGKLLAGSPVSPRSHDLLAALSPRSQHPSLPLHLQFFSLKSYLLTLRMWANFVTCFV